MYLNQKVKIPSDKNGVSVKKIKGVSYVYYAYDRVYNKEKKYTVPKNTTIGKGVPGEKGMMFPNQNYFRYFPEETNLESILPAAPRCEYLKVGTYFVLKKIISEYHLDEMAERIIGKDSGLFLDLAAYSIICEDNAGQYYPDYAYEHPLFTRHMKIYSDSSVSDFINSMSRNQSIEFLNEWNASHNHKDRIYISYDATNKNCSAGDIDLVEFGHPKDDKGKPVVNYSIAYDHENSEPLYYEAYPGSIVDVSQLQYMLGKAAEYGYKHVGFILDRGYFSRENIRYMDHLGYDFVIMVKGMKPFVNDKIREVQGSFEEKRQYTIRRYQVNGTTVKTKVFYSDDKERYLHIYYSYSKAASEREDLESKIDRIAAYLKKQEGQPVVIDKNYEKYFSLEYYHEGKDDQCFVCGIEKASVIEEELKMCGYFCIITSAEMSAKEALDLYKSRDMSEKLFKADKSFLGNRSLRVYTGESLEGKMLIAFVALIIRNRMYTKLKNAEEELLEKPNYMNVPASIRELEKIEMIRQADGVYRLDHAVTATQKTILKAFGIDANYVKRKAREISDQLDPKALKVRI